VTVPAQHLATWTPPCDCSTSQPYAFCVPFAVVMKQRKRNCSKYSFPFQAQVVI